jgi:hypothetical protein
MDDESSKLFREMIELQREQNALLQKYLPPLWTRIRFSLLGLLCLMTFVGAGLGFTVWQIRSLKPSMPPTVTLTTPTTTPFGNPPPTLNLTGSGTLNLRQPSQLIIDPAGLGEKK